MRAIMKPRSEAGLTLNDAPLPRINSDEVMVKVRRVGICGTDLHIYEWDQWAQRRVRPPLILGHEFMGEVVETGATAKGISVGDRVSAESHYVCGHCEMCRTGLAHVCRDTKILGVDQNGAFADYVAVPAANIVPLPASIPDDHAAVFDPLGNAFHTVLHTDISGRIVAIVGCGPIGLFATGIAKAAGAAMTIAVEPHPGRRALARRLGADHALDPGDGDMVEAVAELTRGYGADVVCEMSGHPKGVRSALQMCRNGGCVRLLGLPRNNVDINLARDIIFKGLSVYGVAGRRMYDTWVQMRSFLASGLLDIDPVITHRLPFEDFETGIEVMRSGEAAKVVLSLD